MTSAAEDDEPQVGAGRVAAHDGYDIGRLLAFSDGVFAVAITLLVFSIPAPSVPAGPDLNARLAAALNDLRPSLYGFVLSFVLVGTNWIAHHRMLRHLTFSDTRVLWLNLLMLLGICLVPFATSLLVRYADTSTAVIAYGGLQALIGAMFMLMRFYLAARTAAPRANVLLSLVQISGFAISIPVALRNVQAAYILWIAAFAAARILEGRIRSDAPLRAPALH